MINLRRSCAVLSMLMFVALPGVRAQNDGLPPPRSETMGNLLTAIGDSVRDPVRKEQLLALGREVDSGEIYLELAVEEFARKLLLLNAEYGATRDQFDDLNLEYSARISRQRKRLAGNVLAMQTLAGKEEWRRIGESLAAGLPSGLGLSAGHQLERYGKHLREKALRAAGATPAARRMAIPLDTIDNELSLQERRLNEAAAALAALVRAQQATGERFDQWFSFVDNGWTGALAQSVEARFRLRDVLGPAEWKTIFSAQ